MPRSYELEKIKYLYEEFKNSDLIIFAMEQSVESNIKNLRYVEKVLYSWIDKGIKTRKAAKTFIKDYKKYKGYRKKCYNSEPWLKDSSKWSGYKPPEPKLSTDVDFEGLI